MWFISKARCVQSFREDSVVFAAAFVPIFVSVFAPAFAPAFSTALISANISAVAAFSTVSVSVFASAK
jgi:hypothetical protein